VANYVPQVNETTAPQAFDGPVSVGGGQVSGGPVGPSDVALKTWNFPSYMCTGTATFSVAGSVYLSMVHLAANTTYSNIYVNVLANGGTATTGSNFAGIYNSAGTLVASTGDLSGPLGTGAGSTKLLTFPLATALTTGTSSAPYYVGMFFNASGTASFPVLAGIAGQTAANSLGTLAGQIGNCGGLTSGAAPAAAAPFPFAAIATTSGTALPASFVLGSAGTTGAQCFWTALA